MSLIVIQLDEQCHLIFVGMMSGNGLDRIGMAISAIAMDKALKGLNLPFVPVLLTNPGLMFDVLEKARMLHSSMLLQRRNSK